MDRLTHERMNGIRTGYWTAAKKDDLVARLAAYENTGVTPAEIRELQRIAKTGYRSDVWKDPEQELPALGHAVLVARIIVAGEPPVVEQARLTNGGWWKVYGTNCRRILAWRPLPEYHAKEGDDDGLA